MKNKLKITTLIVLILNSFSCNKDDNTEQKQLSTRVASYYTNDGFFNISYSEDDLIKSIQIPDNSNLTYVVDYNSRNKITSIGSTLYEYDDNDNIISIITENTEATLNYNTEGKISQIVTLKTNTDLSISNSTASFTYNTNGMVDEIMENNTDSPSLTYKNSFTYDSNLNITQILEEESTDDVNFVMTRIQTYTYDDKKHPYYDINNVSNENSNMSLYDFWNFYSIRLSQKSFQTIWHYSPNNYITINRVTSTNATTFFDFENTYNDDNYLTFINRTVTSSTGVKTYAIYGFNYEAY